VSPAASAAVNTITGQGKAEEKVNKEILRDAELS